MACFLLFCLVGDEAEMHLTAWSREKSWNPMCRSHSAAHCSLPEPFSFWRQTYSLIHAWFLGEFIPYAVQMVEKGNTRLYFTSGFSWYSVARSTIKVFVHIFSYVILSLMWKVITRGVLLMTSCHYGVMLMMSFILPLAVPPKRSSKENCHPKKKNWDSAFRGLRKCPGLHPVESSLTYAELSVSVSYW